MQARVESTMQPRVIAYNMPKTAATTPMTPVIPTAGANRAWALLLLDAVVEAEAEELLDEVAVGLVELG